MPDIEELITLLRYPTDRGIKLIRKAYEYAEKAHSGQKRYSGDPYFLHVFETAKILAELGLGPATISAGLLHDVLEDAGITEEELGKEFEKKIVFLVQGVTKLGKIRYDGEERHAESLRKFFVASSKDIRVLIIKLADRLHNMRTLDHVPLEKRRRIAIETMEIYIPLAYRLGIRKIKREMEDLAFKYIAPGEYDHIREMLKEKRVERESQLEKFRKSLLKALAKEGATNVTTDMRTKSFYSIYSKLSRKETSIDKIYDVFALRVNVDTVSDCYKVLGIIHSLWRPMPGRIKDYIAFPKPNGYQSLHTTVFTGDGDIVEIQIRTHEMHDKAEYGIASHGNYKSDKKEKDASYSWFRQFFPEPKFSDIHHDEKIKKIPDWVRQLVDTQAYVSAPGEFMSNLKSDFFQHRMFILDTNGKVIDLPVGSTPVDFAYAISNETGNNLYSVKINGKQAPLNTELKNADVVDIQLKSSSHPTIKWLEYCTTSHAKRQIRLALDNRNKSKV